MNYSQNANEIIKLCQTIIERINQHLRHFPSHEKYALCQASSRLWATHSTAPAINTFAAA